MADKYKEYKKILYGDKYTKNEKYQNNQRTINTYKARLEAGGADVDKALDKRNFLEKALNLTPDQNFIFDIFELINRPQQALFGGIENTQQGGSFLEGAGKGFTGNKKTQFKDILMNTGEFEDEKGKLDLVDALGFAGDVFLDPMDIPFIPISAASTGAKIADTAADAAKIADTATDVAKAADVASDAVRFISPTQGLGMLAKAGISKGVNLADTGIETVLKAIDESKGITYTHPDMKWASELGKMGDGNALLEMYKGMKNNLTTMFNTKLSKSARVADKINDAKEEMVVRYLQENAKHIEDTLEATAPKVGRTTEQVAKDINKIIDVVDEIPMRSVISGAQNGTIKYSKKIENALIDIANDNPDIAEKLIGEITKNKDGMLELGSTWFNKLDTFDVEKLDKMIKRPSIYSMAERKEIEELRKLYQEKAPEAIQMFKDFYNNGNEAIGNTFEAFKGLDQNFLEENLKGYSKHKIVDTYNQNVQKLVDYGANPDDVRNLLHPGQGSMYNTGSKTLNARRYDMPLGEANMLKQRELMSLPGLSKEGKEFVKNNIKLFDDSALAGVQDYINNMPRYAKHTQMLDEVLMTQGFGDLKEMNTLKSAIAKGENVAENTAKLNTLLDNTPFRLVENGKTPYGFKKLDKETKDYLVNFMYSTGNKTGNEALTKKAGELKRLFQYTGGDIAVDPTVLNIIKINTDTTRQSEFVRLYDKLMNYFKGNKTMSLTNQMNNLGGNTMNMFMAGMDGKDYVKYVNQSMSELKNYNDILNKAAKTVDPTTGIPTLKGLTEAEKKIYENLVDFQSYVSLLSPEEIAKTRDLEGIIRKEAKGSKNLPSLEPVRRAFANLNAAEDRLFKYAMFLKAKDDPTFIRNLGIELAENASKDAIAKAAGEAVGLALFDPDNLTAFEKTKLKKIIPFYTFTKKNLAYQITNMGNNLQRYNKLMKAYRSSISNFGEDYDNMADYLKDNMYIPIPTIDKNGNYKFIRAQLPFGDVLEFASNPLEAAVNKSSPILKLPIELATNKNTFTGKDIESFPGQKGTIGILDKIPFLKTAKGQQVLNDLTGLDMPLKQFDKIYSAFKNGRPQDAFINNVTISGNVDTDRLNKSYDDIDELKTLMKQYQQQGYNFSTIQELKKANQNGTVANLNAIFAKYNIK